MIFSFLRLHFALSKRVALMIRNRKERYICFTMASTTKGIVALTHGIVKVEAADVNLVFGSLFLKLETAQQTVRKSLEFSKLFTSCDTLTYSIERISRGMELPITVHWR